MKPSHLQKHGVIYLLSAIALGNAFIVQFKDLSATQMAAMTWMAWLVAIAQFLVAGAIVIVGYLKRPVDDSDDDDPPAPPAPATPGPLGPIPASS